MLYAEQRHKIAVSVGLCNASDTRIYEYYGEVCRRASRNHVAGVLLMPRGVGNDKLATRGGKVSVCHIYRNALLALSLQTVTKQCVVYIVGGRAAFA